MNTRKPETTTIGHYEVTTTKLRPTAALRLAPKILKILTPAIAALNGLSITSADGVERVMSLLAVLDDATLNMLYRELLPETTITMPDDNGVPRVVELSDTQMIDIAFGGLDDGLTLLVKVMLWVGRVNFERSFFEILAQLEKRAAAMKAEAEKKAAMKTASE